MTDSMPVDVPAHIQVHLNAEGEIQWGIITRAKAKSLWSESDLELAGELAMTRQDKSRLRKIMVLADSDIDENPTQRLRALNDSDKQIDVLVKREERLTRLLQIHAEATVGKARDQVKKNQAAKDARETLGASSSLINRPTH